MQNPQLKDGPPVEHLDVRLANEAARFIKDHRDQPFFVCFCPYEVHLPLQTSDELKAKYEAKAGDSKNRKGRFGKEGDSPLRRVQDHPVYAGMVETMDAAVGEVLAALEEAGVADRTVVFFTSDNGGLSTAEGSPTSNLPLRAGKGWMYEGGVRVPLLVRWPGHTKPGTVVDDYIISTDYYPTILDMAGVDPSPRTATRRQELHAATAGRTRRLHPRPRLLALPPLRQPGRAPRRRHPRRRLETHRIL